MFTNECLQILAAKFKNLISSKLDEIIVYLFSLRKLQFQVLFKLAVLAARSMKFKFRSKGKKLFDVIGCFCSFLHAGQLLISVYTMRTKGGLRSLRRFMHNLYWIFLLACQRVIFHPHYRVSLSFNLLHSWRCIRDRAISSTR